MKFPYSTTSKLSFCLLQCIISLFYLYLFLVVPAFIFILSISLTSLIESFRPEIEIFAKACEISQPDLSFCLSILNVLNIVIHSI